MITTVVLCAALTAPGEPSTDAEPDKLVVMPLQSSSLPATSVATLNELLANSVRRLGKHEVLSQSDIDAMLGLENIKDQLGCDDVACAAEIGGALGARMLVSGRVARLGGNIIIVLKLIDTKGQTVEGSAKYKADNDENIYDEAIDHAVLQLFGMEAPPASAASGAAASSDLLRSLISSYDYRRYEAYRATSGHDVPLADWVNEQNRESNLLFVGEIAGGALMLASAGGVFDSFDTRLGGGDEGPPAIFAVGFVITAGLLILDIMDVGAVEISGDL